jgi:hypothetical protein
MRPEQRIVREAYKDAWRIRERTGQRDEELLASALRLRCAAAPFLEVGHPAHDELVRAWQLGVTPDALDTTALVEDAGLRTFLHAVGHLAGRLVPRQVRRDPDWAEMPHGKFALSQRPGRRGRKLLDLVPLSFATLPGADALLQHALRTAQVQRTPWTEVPVWLDTSAATGMAAVQMGDVTVGSTALPHRAWEALRAEEHRHVYADGTLEVTAGHGEHDVSVGTLRCHLPRI